MPFFIQKNLILKLFLPTSVKSARFTKNKNLKTPQIDLTTTNGQIQALRNPAINVRNAAFVKLKAGGDANLKEVLALLEDPNPYVQSRAIFLAAQLGDQGKKSVIKLLDDKNEQIRIVAFRALRHTDVDFMLISHKMVYDPSPFVRREVAAGLRDLSFFRNQTVNH